MWVTHFGLHIYVEAYARVYVGKRKMGERKRVRENGRGERGEERWRGRRERVEREDRNDGEGGEGGWKGISQTISTLHLSRTTPH